MNLTIALLQMVSCGTDLFANQQKGEVFCRRAHAMGADIALFPEMWSIGYTPANPAPPTPPDLWQAPERQAEQPPAPMPDLGLTW
jgi:N-carbamoylputrescine amidase